MTQNLAASGAFALALLAASAATAAADADLAQIRDEIRQLKASLRSAHRGARKGGCGRPNEDRRRSSPSAAPHLPRHPP